MNPCIFSYFMPNIQQATLDAQSSVVKKYNTNNYPHYYVKGEIKHAHAIDSFLEALLKQTDRDVILFLDIDAIPLCEEAIQYYIRRADEGVLIGNAQRSGHLNNDQHMFVAPSAMAISKETYLRLGKISAEETPRSDVMEEYTWKAEELGIEIEMIFPIKYDKAPNRYDWEKNKEPFWRLKDGYPNYGIGTTFGIGHTEYYYHNFQIAHPGHQEMFQQRCYKALNGE